VNEHLWWYTARAAGLVAWVLVTAAVVWGVALTSRIAAKPKPAWVLDLHRFLGGASVVFVAVHLGALACDQYVGFGATDLFVPMASKWKPGAVAWGVVALYLLAAVEVTSLLMRRLPRRWWRSIHFTSYVVFALTIVHALAAGTDAGEPLVQWLALGSVALVGFVTVFRVLAGRRAGRPAAPRPRLTQHTELASNDGV
jgi:predicted ferric reductase